MEDQYPGAFEVSSSHAAISGLRAKLVALFMFTHCITAQAAGGNLKSTGQMALPWAWGFIGADLHRGQEDHPVAFSFLYKNLAPDDRSGIMFSAFLSR